METMGNNTVSSTHQEKAKKMRKLRRWQIIVSLFGVAVIVWGVIEIVFLFLGYKQTETSNDAQIEQYVSPVNLRASGYINKIYFTEHQQVRKGDTLLVLDDREYKIRVMEAEAALKDAQAGATVINATLQTTQTTASVYDASIAEIEIRLAKLEKDRLQYPVSGMKLWSNEMRRHLSSWNRLQQSMKLPLRSWKQPGASGRRLIRE